MKKKQDINQIISHILFGPAYKGIPISVVTAVAFCNEIVDIYLATNLIKTCQHLDPEEYINVEAFSLDELYDMIFSGIIQDSKTISAVMAYMEYKRHTI